MKRRSRLYLQALSAAILLTGVFAGAPAFAQGPGGPPPGPGFGRPGGGGPRQDSVANTPIGALAAGLKLTSDQKAKIAAIQKKLQQQRRDLMPRPGGSEDGGPPDPSTMRANMDKMRSLEQTAVRKIKEVLTSDQKQTLPTFMKELGSLRATGIPIELYGTLKLTTDQKQQLTGIAEKARDVMRQKMDAARESGDFGSVRDAMDQSRRQTHDQAMAILTDAQRSAVEKFIEDHPRPQQGEGFGPPPGGFGPPPDGNGPPPPGDGNGPPPGDGNGPPPPGDGNGPPPPGGPGGPDGA